MWEFICELLPVLAFLTGTLLGGLIMNLFNREQRRHLEAQYRNTSNANIALESQLTAKSKLEEDLSRTNTELEKLRAEFQAIHYDNAQSTSKLKSQNKKLRKELKQYGFAASESEKNYLNEYQQFLMNLEKSIKKAKKKAHKKPLNTNQRIDLRSKKSETAQPSSASKKSKKKKKSGSKYDLYKDKYSGKKFDASLLFADKKKGVKDLTYLYGISPEIQELLYNQGIKTFTDLSRTKIAELRAILALAGEKFENIDPLNWPIQARIADKGQWEILDEYKSKMNSAS